MTPNTHRETTPFSTPPAGDHRLLLVTGPSGAGRSTAIAALEDLDWESIDNMPLGLVPRLLDGPARGRPIALGIDARNRDFSASALIGLIDEMTSDPRVRLEVLYVDCDADILVRRYSETRRRHPLAPAEQPIDGVRREFDLLGPARVRADHLIDTSEMSPHDLREEMARRFAHGPGPRLSVSVQSFSYKRGVPRGVDMVFDCRFLTNPYWQPQLRSLDGRDAQVAAHIATDPRFDDFVGKVLDLLLLLLPAHVDEGKAHLAIGFGCTGGQHRSVAITEKLAGTLALAGWEVSKRHRELERRANAATVGKGAD